MGYAVLASQHIVPSLLYELLGVSQFSTIAHQGSLLVSDVKG